MSQPPNNLTNELDNAGEGCIRWLIRDGRLRSGWRVVSYAACTWFLLFAVLFFALIGFFFLSLVIGIVTRVLLGQSAHLLSGFMEQPLPKLIGDVSVEFIQLFVVLAVTWIWRHNIDKQTVRSLGLTITGKWWLELTSGFFLTGAMWTVFLAILLITSTAYVSTIRIDAETLGVHLIGGAVQNILVGLNEEIHYRGYILQNLIEGLGTLPALIASSVYFGLIHFFNPNPNLLAITSLSIGGLLMGIGYWATRRLWLPIGMHIGWNWFEGALYGFPVSGFPSSGLLELHLTGPDWLTGGIFGPEASIVIIALQLVLIALIFLWVRVIPRSHL